MVITIYIRVYTILAYSVILKHMKYAIQNFIILHTLIEYKGVFFTEKTIQFKHGVGDPPILVMAPFPSAEPHSKHCMVPLSMLPPWALKYE